MKKFLKIFTSWLVIFSVIFGGITFYILHQGESSNNQVKNSDEFTFLLLGVDSDDLYTKNSVRTDTMMLVRYDKISNNISILSIPRDTRTTIRAKKDKINHAHSYGGPELSLKAVNDLLDLNVKYYVRVDYKMVKELVDLIGGVKVNVPMNMVYEPLNINLKKGEQVLDGEEALHYLRFRKGYANQDLGRIEAQQKFIKAAIDKTLQPKNIIKIPQLLSSYAKNVDTNIPFKTLSKYALKVNNIDSQNIETATLPGKPKKINGIWYFIPDLEKSEEMVRKMFEVSRNVVENMLYYKNSSRIETI